MPRQYSKKELSEKEITEVFSYLGVAHGEMNITKLDMRLSKKICRRVQELMRQEKRKIPKFSAIREIWMEFQFQLAKQNKQKEKEQQQGTSKTDDEGDEDDDEDSDDDSSSTDKTLTPDN